MSTYFEHSLATCNHLPQTKYYLQLKYVAGHWRQRVNGPVNYFHTALTPVLVKPGLDKVIALAPEFVQPQDGAAKRWLAAHGAQFARLNTLVLGDDLYCHEPFCRELLAQKLSFILVCKPDSHALVYEWLDHLQRNGAVRTVSHTRWNGRRGVTDTLPLRRGDPVARRG